MFRCIVLVGLVSFGIATSLSADEPARVQIGGWRGNGTGVWTGNPPLSWKRIPHGALEGLRAQTDRPTGDDASKAAAVPKGQIREWLVCGPFPVADSAKEFDSDAIDGETKIEPSTDDVSKGQTWKPAKLTAIDDPKVFGTAEVPALDLAKSFGFQRHQLGYAHVYLHSPRGGKAKVVADHSWGMKAWLNGEEVYRRIDRQAVLGAYPGLSRIELEYQTATSGEFRIALKPGWNRLLLKISTPGPNGHEQMYASLRIIETDDVAYEEENILWKTELPGRSTSTPIIVGDNVLVMNEPDELVCIDRETGRIRWSRFVNHFEAMTREERAAHPEFAAKVDPLVEALKKETNRTLRIKLRGQIQTELENIDATRFKIPRDGHFDAHFGIVGFTMPTPVSDGRRVWVWSGMGVAACFDLEGNRQWMTPVRSGPLTYASTPALVDGVLAVYLNKLFGLNAETGEIVWDQPKVNKNTASLLAATVAGQPVIVTQEAIVVRPRDGHILYRPRGLSSNDTGWSPGVFVGDVLHQPRYGIKNLILTDFGGQSGDAWKPRDLGVIETPPVLDRAPDGGWLDRSTAASPLVVGRYAYSIDMYSQLCVYDLESKKVVHHRELELDGFTHYNALAVAASPTSVGEHIFIVDNQGTTLVLTQGAEPKVVHRNVIATQLDRSLPLPSQEILAYAPPVVSGDRLYLRGERYLYCIGRPSRK